MSKGYPRNNIKGHRILQTEGNAYEEYFASPGAAPRQLAVISASWGSPTAEIPPAATTVIAVCAQMFQESARNSKDPTKFLKEMALKATLKLMEVGSNLNGYAATLTGFFRVGRKLYAINVGGGGVALFRHRRLQHLTDRHLVNRRMVDILPPKALEDDTGLAQVASLLGHDFVPLNMALTGPLPLKRGDVVFAFSQEILATYDDSQLSELLFRFRFTENISKELVQLAQRQGHLQNLSVCHLNL